MHPRLEVLRDVSEIYTRGSLDGLSRATHRALAVRSMMDPLSVRFEHDKSTCSWHHD